MKSLLRYANPLVAIRSSEEALKAARTSSVALVLGALHFSVSAVFMFLNRESALIQAREQLEKMEGMSPESAAVAENVAGAIFSASLVLNPVFAAIQLVLAWVQWKWPNLFIPAVFAALCGFALLSALQTIPFWTSGIMPDLPMTKVVAMIGGYAVATLQMVLHITGARGAAKLRDFARR